MKKYINEFEFSKITGLIAPKDMLFYIIEGGILSRSKPRKRALSWSILQSVAILIIKYTI